MIDSVISHDEFVLINNARKKYNDMKEEIKDLKLNPSFGLCSRLALLRSSTVRSLTVRKSLSKILVYL